MARFLLVHGAAHGAWCWRDVLPALADLGHDAVAIDLPSHGQDRTPLAQVTLDLYAQAVVQALEGPTVIVGHSMAGYPITRAAQIAPERAARLIYLCAYTPWPGLSLAQMRRAADRQPLVSAIRRNPDGISMHFDPDQALEKFYADCPWALDYALAHLCDQALAPMETALPVPEPGPGPEPEPGPVPAPTLPRSYITCRQDGAIPPEFQDVMAARFAPEDRHQLDSGHSPFFSMPQALAALLHRIVS